jgi:hypothetical protein
VLANCGLRCFVLALPKINRKNEPRQMILERLEPML